MDVVIQFAVHKLGFQLSDIVVYAWSIGGFTGRQLGGVKSLLMVIGSNWFQLFFVQRVCYQILS